MEENRNSVEISLSKNWHQKYHYQYWKSNSGNQYLSFQISDRIVFVLKTKLWIPVLIIIWSKLSRMIITWGIKQKPSLIFFDTPFTVCDQFTGKSFKINYWSLQNKNKRPGWCRGVTKSTIYILHIINYLTVDTKYWLWQCLIVKTKVENK